MSLLSITFFIVGASIVGALLVIIRAHQYPAKVRKAQEYLDNGDIAKASEIVKLVLERKKDYIPARYLRAQILIQQKQYLLAIAELNGILSIPDFDKYVEELNIHYQLADLYHETQQWQKEVEEFRVILQFNPDDINANHRLGIVLYRQHDYTGAKDYLLKAVTLDPALSDIYAPLGICLYNTGEYGTAENFLIKAVETNATNYEAHYYLGMIFKMKKDYTAALEMLSKARNDRRYFDKSQYAIGQLYFDNDAYSKAIEELEKGLPYIKDNTDEGLAYRYLLAECYEMENKIPEAVHHWEKIASINPNYRSTQVKLDDYKLILENKNLKFLFTSTMAELQPLITEIIAQLNYSIVYKKEVSANEYMYKCFSVKRINEPPVLINFIRTTRDITEGQINTFYQRMLEEKCKSGIYITTSKFSINAKSQAANKMIEIMDGRFLQKAMEKIKGKKG
ncbi:MAG TPA: tetratricopeptide repeat protein [Spirochaetota bacterium]|nr:tetratricopeptide repeat protein [Spirochaetota bacterium]HOF14128.1 tetratricopeptide repeat protein [Spirochaetota bacterium]HPD04100.1 tetratricopeptide repeat protein [Spirochaetota bacterium]HQI37993.1 tetratricopeptide repeat protein [Spirochaetota bacterium]HQK07363.1 tetratricopeptide repeat protein [Spirochaetota bacterium]